MAVDTVRRISGLKSNILYVGLLFEIKNYLDFTIIVTDLTKHPTFVLKLTICQTGVVSACYGQECV